MKDWLNIAGKTVIVTGASSGIGQAIVKELLDLEVNVVNFDIANNDLEHEHYLFVKVDVTSRQEVEAGVAKIFGECGDKKKSMEDIEMPKAFEFLQDTYLSVMVVMVPLYIITAAFAGSEAVDTGSQNYLMYAFLQSIQFVVGIYVLLAGVRLLLGEIVPAFRGIAMKLVPDAIPALDCPSSSLTLPML